MNRYVAKDFGDNKTSKKVRFGIVGTNSISTKVINAARLDDRFQLAAVYSRQQETADAFAQKHNIPHTFTSLEEMASSNLIDAIYIASPNSLHAQQSILCMSYGKHVLCEKPFASNAYEAKQMIEASENYNVTLMEAMKPPMEPNFRSIIRNIDKLGTIRHYFASYCQYSSRYDNLKKGIVGNAFKLELSNGATMDIGVYTIYPMVVLFGEPKKIKASGILLPTGVDGHGIVNFEYDDMTATIAYSKIADSYLPFEIQGEEGTIISDRVNYFNEVKIVDRQKNATVISIPQKDTYYYEIAEFIDLIQNNKRESSILSHNNSLIAIKIVDEIRKQLNVIYPADNKE